MFNSPGLINLRSIFADRIARTLVAVFAVTLLQGIFTGPEIVYAEESPAIEISAPAITTIFGTAATGIITPRVKIIAACDCVISPRAAEFAL